MTEVGEFAELTMVEKSIRLFVYEFFVREARSPTLNEIARHAALTPLEANDVLQRLESEHAAVVLSPGSSNIWLADPFAALPTPFPVRSGEKLWYGMCAWDALGILCVAGVDGFSEMMCPLSGTDLALGVEGGKLVQSEGVIHFAVPAARWWEDIGFT